MKTFNSSNLYLFSYTNPKTLWTLLIDMQRFPLIITIIVFLLAPALQRFTSNIKLFFRNFRKNWPTPFITVVQLNTDFMVFLLWVLSLRCWRKLWVSSHAEIFLGVYTFDSGQKCNTFIMCLKKSATSETAGIFLLFRITDWKLTVNSSGCILLFIAIVCKSAHFCVKTNTRAV